MQWFRSGLEQIIGRILFLLNLQSLNAFKKVCKDWEKIVNYFLETQQPHILKRIDYENDKSKGILITITTSKIIIKSKSVVLNLLVVAYPQIKKIIKIKFDFCVPPTRC